MVTRQEVVNQLDGIGSNFQGWGRTEIAELYKLLWPNEVIKYAINGYYDGGFALLCVTNLRVLIIDKKPLSFTVEDLRYDMIAEVDYCSRVITAKLDIITPLRTLVFTTWVKYALRNSSQYIQQRLMALRSDPHFWANQAVDAEEMGLEAPPPSAVREPIIEQAIQMQPVPIEAEAIHSAHMAATNPFLRVPTFSRRRRYPSFY